MKKSPLMIVFATALFLTGSLSAFEWPVEKRLLSRTFGTNDDGQFYPGIEVFGNAQNVGAAYEGEVIFTFGDQGGSDDLPSGLGSFVVLQHADELRTVYAHLEFSPEDDSYRRVDQGDLLGVSGSSGWIEGGGLGFIVLDNENDQLINPLQLLPGIIDKSPPIIQGIWLQYDGEEPVPVVDNAVYPAGNPKVFITTRDISEETSYLLSMAPYRVAGYLNGKDIFKVTFVNFRSHNGRLTIYENESLTYDSLYSGRDRWELSPGKINLYPGDLILEIMVADTAGNATVREVELKVQAPGGNDR